VEPENTSELVERSFTPKLVRDWTRFIKEIFG